MQRHPIPATWMLCQRPQIDVLLNIDRVPKMNDFLFKCSPPEEDDLDLLDKLMTQVESVCLRGALVVYSHRPKGGQT